MDPIATPITDPAMPILAASRKEVTAAKAPARIWDSEIPLKKFFTLNDDNRKSFTRA
jgi:hypothetical protein